VLLVSGNCWGKPFEFTYSQRYDEEFDVIEEALPSPSELVRAFMWVARAIDFWLPRTKGIRQVSRLDAPRGAIRIKGIIAYPCQSWLEWACSRMTLPSLLLLAIGLVLLGVSSGVVVTNLVAITEKRRLRKSVISFILLAVSTSLPELVVAINAIVLGNMTVSLGDILGSNIVNVALIVGVCFLAFSLKNSGKKKIAMGEKDMKQFTNGLILLSGTLLALLYLQYMSRYIGIMLLCVFFVYSFKLFKKRKEDGGDGNGSEYGKIRKELALTAIAIAGVIIGARLTVESAIDIAVYFGVPASIIGATLVAFGTGLPELTVDVRAAVSGHLDIVIGDIVGSCFMNSTLVLGLLLTFTPFERTINLAVVSELLLFSVISNLVLWYFLDNNKTGYKEGVILFSLYMVNLFSILEILVLRIP